MRSENETMFESSVISYGCQTRCCFHSVDWWFESSVISYGCQTSTMVWLSEDAFESSVISNAYQTIASVLFLFSLLSLKELK